MRPTRSLSAPEPALVVRTLHGDGSYPVMAELTPQGQVRRVILDLDPHHPNPDDEWHDDWDDD
jgi:hypothetical protein